MLTICELGKAIVNDFIHELVDEDKIRPEQLLVDAATEVVDALPKIYEKRTYRNDGFE